MLKESKSGILFRHWVRANGHRLMTGSYELKDSRSKGYISFAEIREEQINHAQANQSVKGNLTRIASGTVGSADYHFLRKSTGWFVLCYPKAFYIVSVDNFLFEKSKGKKSLTEVRAEAIATHSVIHR